MKTIIKNGRVVTAVDDYKADILIENERVSVIGISLDMEADLTIDATGKLVIPGGIDPHTHMELPFGGTESSDDFRTGTIGAAHGGTTSINDFAVQFKGHSLIEGIVNWLKKGEGRSVIDYGCRLSTTEVEEKQSVVL
jgi:dihydropyrimidinase